METFRLNILPVYSAFHATAQMNGVRLLQHQAETLDAYNHPDVDVIINTAMTGDGKSLAAYLPAFQQQHKVVAMYPTNELIKDQGFALLGYQQRLGIRLPRYDTMYSEKITQLMREHDNTVRLEEVRKLLKRNGILLTNPDLIHLIMSHQYGWDFMRKELAVLTGMKFNYFLFDEFHVFGVPQIISVMNMLGYLAVNYRNKPNERRKFIFLSATPSQLLEGLLARSGLRHRTINGHYRSSFLGNEYRCILQSCGITLHEISQEATTEHWVEEHLEEIHRFFLRNPNAKAAILVSSPATARRLVARLQEYFAPHGITIGENTGLTPQDERRDALNKHILVGTSTVDVGIDFHINFLIFEAFNAGSFLQRFGRLGRHDEFSEYHAHALVPRFVLERLMTRFANEHEVEREHFNEAIREAFPTEQEFAGYKKIWGVVQATHVLVEMELQQKKDANQSFREALTEEYDKIYGTTGKSVMQKACKTYWRLHKQFPEILQELLSFRGQSPLECAVWDTTTTETHPYGTLLTYDLFFLLSNTQFEVIEEATFMQEVKRRNLEEQDFKKKLLYLKIHRYVEERLNLVLGLNYNMMEYSHTLHHIQVLKGVLVREPHHTWLNEVNRKLKKLGLVGILSDMQRGELKMKLQLGAVFPVYRLQDSLGSEYSIAFGQDALLLDTILAFRKPKRDRGIIA